MDLPPQEKSHSLNRADTAILVVAPANLRSYPTFRVFREEPDNVSIIGKAEYNLRLIDINTIELPEVEFDTVKALFSEGDSLGDSEWAGISSRLDAGRHPVIFVYGIRLRRERPNALKIQDGIYNFTLAPMLYLLGLGGSLYTGFSTYRDYEYYSKNTVIYTNEMLVRVWHPKERKISPDHGSKYIVQTKQGHMNRTSAGDIEDRQLKELFRKMFQAP